jgi:magnesium chelatase family protein
LKFDLAIVAAVLAAKGVFGGEELRRTALLGELGLGFGLRPVRRILPSTLAWPSTHVGHELVAAGMLIMAARHDGKPLDYDELERRTRVGYERGMRSRKGER